MRKLKQEKGITLVALIITIIVMMILVAVSVAIIINSDLLGTAKNAGTSFKGKMAEEESMGTANIKINDEETTMADYIESIDEASTVTFWLYNSNDECWDEFTAPADATWGDFWNYVPDEDMGCYRYVTEEDGHFGSWLTAGGTVIKCPNLTGPDTPVGLTTLTPITEAPIPHLLSCLTDNGGPGCCNIEHCPYFDADLLPND